MTSGSDPRKEGLIGAGSRVLSTTKQKAADHVTSAVRKQRETNAGAQLAFSLWFSSSPLNGGASVKPLWKLPHRHTQKFVL